MKCISRIAVFAAVAAIFVGVAGVATIFAPPELNAATPNIATYDIACDCRTGVGGPNRGDPFIITGKIFPAGTLPTGPATNDPTQPVNGVQPIGTWTCRGQNAAPFPGPLVDAYGTSPFAYFDWHFVFNDGRGLNAAGYPTVATGEAGALSVTGGIGAFFGAAGEIRSASFGVNATGCPNFRVNISFRPGSLQ